MRLVFEGGFDGRAAEEDRARGYRSHVTAELEDGRRYAVSFYTTERLAQDLAEEASRGTPWIGEPGLIIVAEITHEIMLRAVTKLEREGFFSQLAQL